MTQSKKILEEVCGKPVRYAAIPFGRYNAAVIAAGRKAGYEALYSSDGGSSNPQAFLRPRSTVRSDTTDEAFESMLDGRLPLSKRLRRAASMRLKRLI
jgi:peptidoglycan/xylan/chitin deacetylase (PgdA/CDA1 family)